MNFRSPFVFLFILVISCGFLSAQVDVQSLREELKAAPEDYKKIKLLLDAAKKVASSHPEVAIEFTSDALSLSKKRLSKEGQAQSLSYLGLLYVNKKDFPKAQTNLRQAINLKKQLISKKKQYKSSIAKDYRLLGHTEEQQGKDDAALKAYQNGVKYAIGSKNRYEYAWGMFQVGQLQNKLGDHATAVGALNRSIEQANKLGLSNLARNADRIKNASMAVLESKLEKEEIENEVKVIQQEFESAQEKIEAQQEYTEVLVSEKEALELERENIELDLKLKAQELDRVELEKLAVEAEKAKIEAENARQLEMQKREEERYQLIGIGAGAVFLVIFLFMLGRNRSRRKHARAIEAEKKKSEELLYKVLPKSIANEHLLHGKVKSQKYEEVSILFTDFKGFTRIAAKMNPDKLISDLNYAFQAFDFIVAQYGLEKIKTIGDAYMAAAGVPAKTPHHALDAVGVALEMQGFMEDWRKEKLQKGETPWELRIGIHSGPVIAGVIGDNRFTYDIWGDAVNMASRMESSGEAGKINISARTYELIKKVAGTSYRGKIEVKNAGAVDMYFVNKLFVKRKFKQTTP